jgi:hypothetical protein
MNPCTNKQTKRIPTAIWALNGYLGLLMVTVAFDKSDSYASLEITVATVDDSMLQKIQLVFMVSIKSIRVTK